MQPYAFPYLGYFQLINYVDKWVVFDEVQYISRGWINRNRILHPDESKDWQYFTVPIRKHSKQDLISSISINQDIQWQSEILGKLSSYKKKAPYYQQTVKLVEHCFDLDGENLSHWLVASLNKICAYLEISFDYTIFSRSSINVDRIEKAGDWALEIADGLEADEYINPPGGYSIFRESDFVSRGTSLRFLQSGLQPYNQARPDFVPGLSILDVLMWNDPEEIRLMMNDFNILTYNQLQEMDNE